MSHGRRGQRCANSTCRPAPRGSSRLTIGPMPRERELHDEYFLKAKAEGYVARSAYKLLQIQERFNILRPGDAVLDLGCAPGSWIQVAHKLIGPYGVILGIDLQPVTIPRYKNVRTLVGDAFQTPPIELLRAAERSPGSGEIGPRGRAIGGMFSVILSDMAPNTSGNADDLRSARLCRRVLELAAGVLAPNGRLVMKVLEGGEHKMLLTETARDFRFVKGHRPAATRDVSREIFIVAEGYKPPSKIRPGIVLAGQTAPADESGAPQIISTTGAPPAGTTAPSSAGWSLAAPARIPPHKRGLGGAPGEHQPPTNSATTPPTNATTPPLAKTATSTASRRTPARPQPSTPAVGRSRKPGASNKPAKSARGGGKDGSRRK